MAKTNATTASTGSGGGITSPLTTKGDLWGFTTLDARFPVGSDHQILIANSAAPSGLSWSATQDGDIMKVSTYDPGGIASQLLSTAFAQTATNKRIKPRVVIVNAPGATPTTNTNNADFAKFTGLATAITSMTTNLSGSPSEDERIVFEFTDNGTPRAITWGSSFQSTTVTLPVTTVASTKLRVGFYWNSDASKWDCVAVA